MGKKILYFEYIVSLLVQWYEQECPVLKGKALSSFTRLKALKLLFLVTAVDASPKAEEDGLLNIFDNFYAMQHGPVESDIYDAMVHHKTSVYEFEGTRTIKKEVDSDPFLGIDEQEKMMLEGSVESLKKKNPNLITYKPFDLVDVTHKWSSWQVAYKVAQFIGKGSERMSIESIKQDNKYFS